MLTFLKVLAAALDLETDVYNGTVQSHHCIHRGILDRLVFDNQPITQPDITNFWRQVSQDLVYVLQDYYVKWPPFTGWIPYPVPHPILTPRTATTLNHWCGEYGDNRKDLLDFIIRQLMSEMLCAN